MISVETHSMINSEHPTATTENVTTLAVGVVDQHIENGKEPEVGDIGVDHRNGTIISIKALNRSEPAMLGHLRTWNKINKLVRGRLVDIHPDLKRARAERPIGEHSDRHAIKTTDSRDLVRRNLAKPKGAMRKVPERPFSVKRLVDALDGRAAGLQLSQERGVGRLQQTAGDPQLCFRQLSCQSRMWGPGVTIVNQPAETICRHRRNQSNSGLR